MGEQRNLKLWNERHLACTELKRVLVSTSTKIPLPGLAKFLRHGLEVPRIVTVTTTWKTSNLAICAFFAALNGALFTVGGNHGYGTWGFREDRDGVGWVATIEVIMLIVSFSACMGFVPVEACSFYHRPSW